MKYNKRQLICDIFRIDSLSEYEYDFYSNRLNEVMKILDEREQCVICGIINQKTQASLSKEVANLTNRKGYFVKYCDGVSPTIIMGLKFRAIRKMRAAKKVWCGEMSAIEYIKKRLRYG